MSKRDPATSPLRRGLILSALLAPFLILAPWSLHLLRQTRTAHHEMDHCTLWNQEIVRHRDAFELVHLKAVSLVGASDVGVEAATVEAAASTLQRSRETLGQRTHEEADPALASLDRVMRDYTDQVRQVRETAAAWAGLSAGSGKDDALASFRVALAHLDHRRQDVLAAFQALERRHRIRLEAAIEEGQTNMDGLSQFAIVSLLLALGFGIAAGVALWLKGKHASASHFARTLVDTLPEGLLAWDGAGHVLSANAALARTLGAPAEALLVGASLDGLLPREVRRQLETSTPGTRLSFNLDHPGGRILALEAAVGAVHTPEGPIHIAVLRDISRSMEAERRLSESQRMAELGHNMAGLCRDLQRLFHPVLLSVEMLKASRNRETPDSPAWTQLERNAVAASDLLAQIVRFANQDLHPENASTFDMNACLQEVVESVQTEGTSLTRLTLELAAIPAMVVGPRDRFKASLELLLQRALDASGEGAPVQVRTWDEDGSNCLEILDTGDAIPASQIHRVFEPVYLTSMGGPESGFGLFNVAATIQSMGGSIQADRLDGGWTRFQIRVPQGW